MAKASAITRRASTAPRAAKAGARASRNARGKSSAKTVGKAGQSLKPEPGKPGKTTGESGTKRTGYLNMLIMPEETLNNAREAFEWLDYQSRSAASVSVREVVRLLRPVLYPEQIK